MTVGVRRPSPGSGLFGHRERELDMTVIVVVNIALALVVLSIVVGLALWAIATQSPEDGAPPVLVRRRRLPRTPIRLRRSAGAHRRAWARRPARRSAR